jgi:hypothetical protein
LVPVGWMGPSGVKIVSKMSFYAPISHIEVATGRWLRLSEAVCASPQGDPPYDCQHPDSRAFHWFLKGGPRGFDETTAAVISGFA